MYQLGVAWRLHRNVVWDWVVYGMASKVYYLRRSKDVCVGEELDGIIK